MIGMQTELDYLIGDFAACFGNTQLAIPKGSIHFDKQKCQSKVLRLWQLLRMMPSKRLVNNLVKNINR